MKTKTIVTIMLTLFVITSVVYLVVDEMRGNPPGDTNERDITDIDVLPGAGRGDVTTAAVDDMVVVYYFHGNFRCPSCLTIEQLTREAILGGFEDELRDGLMALRVINMQEPVNRAYVEDFQLEYYMVVLERIEDGERRDWEKLEDVWDLYTDKEGFIEYVQEETRDFIEER